MKLKHVLIEEFDNKVAIITDDCKVVYQSVINNISTENTNELCKYFGITTAQKAEKFVENVKISWQNHDLITTKQ